MAIVSKDLGPKSWKEVPVFLVEGLRFKAEILFSAWIRS